MRSSYAHPFEVLMTIATISFASPLNIANVPFSHRLCANIRRHGAAAANASLGHNVTSEKVHKETHALQSLRTGTWFKLICGASTHDSPSVRNLSEVYTVAGADCIDVAADPAIICAAREGIERAVERGAQRPLLMASVNDGADVHFRKAYFDPNLCPSDCPRPCEAACPAEAIAKTGVVDQRCYGCGRCIPVCPHGFVHARDYVHGVQHIRDVLYMVDALEIHTGPSRLESFRSLWNQIENELPGLQVVSISFPDLGDDQQMTQILKQMWNIMLQVVNDWRIATIWQTDGRPMSGDIGPGTAHASIRLAQRVRQVLTTSDMGGHVQLAGGTNWKTVPLMMQSGLFRPVSSDHTNTADGVAMGGYARKVRPYLSPTPFILTSLFKMLISD